MKVAAVVVAIVGLLGNRRTNAFVITQPSLVSLRRTAASPPPCRSLSMASTSDFKNGLTIVSDGAPVKIIEFLHVKPGKGSAFVRSKLKNLVSGNTVEKTFRAGESVELANVQKVNLQFTYEADDTFFFMDTETFEEVSVPSNVVGDTAQWIMEGSTVDILKWNDKVIEVAVPNTMVLKVAETTPNVKGNTAQGGSKPAVLESGATIQVPLFIVEGEALLVDTVAKKYLSRAGDREN